MTKNNVFVVSFEDVYEWTNGYFSEMGLPFVAKEIIDIFVQKNMFSVEGSVFIANIIYFYHTLQHIKCIETAISRHGFWKITVM